MPARQLNIIIPVFNEALILRENIGRLQNWLTDNLAIYDWQIIIADNNSTDQTGAIGRELTAADKRVRYFFIPQKGRGLALRRSFLEFPADFAVYMDVDLATDLSALPTMMRGLDNEAYDIVTGSRFAPGSQIQRSLLREIVSRGYVWLVKAMFHTPLSDLQCGFKGINKKVVANIVPQTKDKEWFFDTELLLLAEQNNYKIKSIPINWVETRSIGRKSKVKLIKSIAQFVHNLMKFKKT